VTFTRGASSAEYAAAFGEPARYAAETPRVRAYVLTLRGMVRQGLNAHEEAVADFDAALGCDPSLGDIHVHRSISQLALGQPDAAVAGLCEALALGSEPAVANDKLGQARRQLGAHEQAVEAYTCALAHHPSYPPYLSRRAAALR
jgi:tetratricopeptide (TPR) repeat protein